MNFVEHIAKEHVLRPAGIAVPQGLLVQWTGVVPIAAITAVVEEGVKAIGGQ